tara:strand:+ start:790 stop:1029 length:240 start_codon:yes stop_codon:yes gene_type:complete
MFDYMKGLISGIIISFSLFLFMGLAKNDKTEKMLSDIQHNIKNIESDVYRMSEKGVECIGSVRCGGGFVDSIEQAVDCK